MRILFDPDFDAGTWPGPRDNDAAVAGALWLGRDGLLSRLETQLGLGGPHASAAERAAALVPRLFRDDRFYGASARADPWATAQRLLEWRDHLWEHGWRGEGASERRLGELAEVTLELPPGRAERLETVAGWLESRSTDVEEVGLVAPRATLSPAFRRVLEALERGGTRVRERAPEDAPSRGNLAAVRRPGAVVTGPDTTLQLVRPAGPREAARALAAALAADPGLDETLFIGPDGLLDEALDEAGLPTLGVPAAHDVGALAELLPMTLQLVWAPVDPQLALDWLTLPDLPLPRVVATRLAATLDRWPAVGNPDWLEAEEAALDTEPDRGAVRSTLQVVFSPLAPRGGQVHVRDLLPRLDLLERWAAERAPRSSAHEVVLRQASSLRARFRRAELHRLTQPRLDAVLASVVGDPAVARSPALAGYSQIGAPGGMAGPARRVIWWGFHGTPAARRGAVTLRASERRALASIGVELPAPGAEVRGAAARARRPLVLTGETLILISPRSDQTGEPAHPHPLWDEIVSHLADPRDARHLVTGAPLLASPPARTIVTSSLPSRPRRTVRTTLPIARRAVESPTSLEKLLGCSFAYALEYNSRMRRRPLSVLSAESRLLGNVAHEVLARTARDGALSRDEPERAALRVLDRTVQTHAALLLLPGFQEDLMLLRAAVQRAAALLGHVVQTEGLRVDGVERTLTAPFGERSLSGTPDLVLADGAGRLVLLDLKWSGEGYHRDLLRSGTALQLAGYAELLRRTIAPVRTLGYLILKSGCLLVRGEPLALARRVHPELLDATWAAVERSWVERAQELERGDLFAEGVAAAGHTPLAEAALRDGRLVVPPPCGRCALDLLCGRGPAAS